VSRVKCKLCGIRPARRFCPGVAGDICAVCCGTEREVSIDCPLDCEHLRAARQHEKPLGPPPERMLHSDIPVTEAFLEANQDLCRAVGGLLFAAAIQKPGIIDLDMRDALDAMIRTHRTLDSGLVYETRPANPIAAAVQSHFEKEMAQVKETVFQKTGVHAIRDNDVLRLLVFFSRVEADRNNGRRRGRAFIDSLRYFAPPPQSHDAGAVVEPASGSLIL
jgi:hypothetical protein